MFCVGAFVQFKHICFRQKAFTFSTKYSGRLDARMCTVYKDHMDTFALKIIRATAVVDAIALCSTATFNT
jgi:hypothetical protein